MQESRRNFVKLLGTSAILPAAVPAEGFSLWQRAEIELEQTGQVSGDLTLALLDAQGTRGIFEDPKHFEALRTALARKIRDHKTIRSFPIPDDVEPLLGFRR